MRSVFALVVSMALFGCWGVVSVSINLSAPVLLFVMALTVVGFMLCFRVGRIDRTLFNATATLIALNLTIDLVLLVVAYRYIPFGVAISLHYLGPVIVTLMAPFMLKERFRTSSLILIFFALIGAWMVCKPLFNSNNASFYLGILCATLSAFTLAGNIIFQRKYMRTKTTTPQQAIVNINIWLVLFLILPAGFSAFTSTNLSKISLLEAMGAGLLIQGLALYLFNYAARSLSATELGTISYTEVLWSVVIGLVLFNQQLALTQLIGMIIIVITSILGLSTLWRKDD
jgi:drug/metabolite transporter (DMT)-like permease